MRLNVTFVDRLRRERAWTQEHLATAAGIDVRTYQRMLAGQSMSFETAQAIASALEVKIADLRIDDNMIAPAQPSGRHDVETPSPTVNAPRTAPLTSVLDLLGRGTCTLVTGDRRNRPVENPSDVLLPVGWTDFALLHTLKGIGAVVPDQDLAADWFHGGRERRVFRESLVCIGAPDVNFASLLINGSALYGFVIDEDARSRLLTFFAGLSRLEYREQVESLHAAEQELRGLLRRLSPSAFRDPSGNEHRFHAAEHGVVSLAAHPFLPEIPCVLAGGVTGGLTAGAVALLAEREIYDPMASDGHRFNGLRSRPFGGLFRRRHVARPRPDDILHIEEDLEWVTPPYSKDELLEALNRNQRTPSARGLTIQDLDRLGAFLKASPAANGSAIEMDVLIPTGGDGKRMERETGGTISKLELLIPVSNVADRTPKEAMVIEMVVGAVDQAAFATDIEFLTTAKHQDSQARIAEKLTRELRLHVSCSPQESGTGLLESLLSRIDGRAQRGLWSMVLMGDTLISPKGLRRLIQEIAADQPNAGIGCSEVPLGAAARYGVVHVDDRGYLKAIVEKPGAANRNLVSQGLYVFSPAVSWKNVRRAFRGPDDLSTFLTSVASKIPVKVYSIEGPIFDCGSLDGLEQARCAGKQGLLEAPWSAAR